MVYYFRVLVLCSVEKGERLQPNRRGLGAEPREERARLVAQRARTHEAAVRDQHGERARGVVEAGQGVQEGQGGFQCFRFFAPSHPSPPPSPSLTPHTSARLPTALSFRRGT